MPKFVKKPVIVEATQWNQPGDHRMVVSLGTGSSGEHDRQAIMTEKGWVQVYVGDWIVSEVGGLYSVIPWSIFDEEYEQIEVDDIDL